MADTVANTTIVESLKALIAKLGGEGADESTIVEALKSVYVALGGTDDTSGIVTIVEALDKVTEVAGSGGGGAGNIEVGTFTMDSEKGSVNSIKLENKDGLLPKEIYIKSIDKTQIQERGLDELYIAPPKGQGGTSLRAGGVKTGTTYGYVASGTSYLYIDKSNCTPTFSLCCGLEENSEGTFIHCAVTQGSGVNVYGFTDGASYQYQVVYAS